MSAKVSHDFLAIYDACALMAMSQETCWAKLAFEYTDIGTRSVVSVVTNQFSDDANGVDVEGHHIYLQLSKKGNVFAMHYSLDGQAYKMTRYFCLPESRNWRVGFVAQSPIGKGGKFKFSDIQFHEKTPKDLRNGN